jgi:hypothetical protein
MMMMMMMNDESWWFSFIVSSSEQETGTKTKTQQGHSIPKNYEILGAMIYPYLLGII